MTQENQTNQDHQGNNPQGADEAPLIVNAQYIKDLSFEHPDPQANYKGHSEQPQISLNIDLGANNLEKSDYEVILTVKAEAKQGSKVVYVIELHYGGIFTLGEAIPQEMIHPILMIECPRLLFPYARAIISNTTREGGFPPLALNPVDFAALYQQHFEAQQEEKKPNKRQTDCFLTRKRGLTAPTSFN